jgi:hypothetical protein
MPPLQRQFLPEKVFGVLLKLRASTNISARKEGNSNQQKFFYILGYLLLAPKWSKVQRHIM